MMPIRFGSSAAEQAFQLHYGAVPVTIGLFTVLMGAVVHIGSFFIGVLRPDLPTETVATQQSVLSLASIFLYLGHFALLGKQRFILSRGLHSVWHRVLHATGMLSWIKPQECVGYCQLLWQHRLFLVHFVGAATRIPVGWYWFGGVLSCLVLAAVDVVDSNGSCGQSPACLLSALQAHAAEDMWQKKDMWQLLQNVLVATLRSSRVFAVDVVLPGLLLTWLELRARRAWWQQQQASQQQLLQQIRSEAAAHNSSKTKVAQAAAAAAATAAGCDCSSSKHEAPATATAYIPQNYHQSFRHCLQNTAAAETLPVGSLSSQQQPAAPVLELSSVLKRATTAAAPAAALAAVPVAAAPAGSPAPASVTAAPAAAASVGPYATAQAPPHPHPHPLLYSSPVGRRVVSFNFVAAPGGEAGKVQ
jgi:hypothetical protein